MTLRISDLETTITSHVHFSFIYFLMDRSAEYHKNEGEKAKHPLRMMVFYKVLTKKSWR